MPIIKDYGHGSNNGSMDESDQWIRRQPGEEGKRRGDGARASSDRLATVVLSGGEPNIWAQLSLVVPCYSTSRLQCSDWEK